MSQRKRNQLEDFENVLTPAVGRRVPGEFHDEILIVELVHLDLWLFPDSVTYFLLSFLFADIVKKFRNIMSLLARTSCMPVQSFP